VKRLELLRLIDQGESQLLDFKKTITHKYKIAKTLVSFANTKGGKILVGVMDDGQIIGVDVDEEMHSLHDAAVNFCQPAVKMIFTEVEDKYGNLVLVVDIPESEQKPHRALDTQGNWQAYIRTNDKTMIAGKMSIKSMEFSGKRKSLDSLGKLGSSLNEFFQQEEKITVRQFAALANISERRAKRFLIDLAREGVLFEHDINKEQFYTLG